VQIYGEETLDENGNIIPFIDQAAIMTHYLQLHNKNIDMPYAAQAEGILNLWYEFIKGENNKKNCGMVAESAAGMQTYLFPDLFQAPFQAPANPKFTFIDLFAGIGGFRMAFQNLGGECVFSSEWDEQAKKTYYANYGDVPFGDITKESTKKWIDVREENPVPAKYYLSTTYIDTLKRHKARHEAKGNGFGYDIIPDDGIAHAIVVGGMGRECNLVIDFRQKDLTPTTRIKGEVNKKGWRKMTPREWARLQGYPDNFKIVVADASAYKQFGNSVAVPAIQATAAQLLKTLKEYGYFRE
jgi:site-specific DNA-cytosine methylase